MESLLNEMEEDYPSGKTYMQGIKSKAQESKQKLDEAKNTISELNTQIGTAKTQLEENNVQKLFSDAVSKIDEAFEMRKYLLFFNKYFYLL